jgi:hypothetical protein
LDSKYFNDDEMRTVYGFTVTSDSVSVCQIIHRSVNTSCVVNRL